MTASSPPFEPLAIRASAGSGKTYQLTNRLLALVLSEVPVENILATTFTRKAAAEIAERVVVRLARAALDPEVATALSRDLERPLDSDEAARWVVRLSRSLDRWQMTTLDAFFLSIATRFELELCLPPRWSIGEHAALNHDRESIVHDLLEAEDWSEQLQLLRLLGRGVVSRSIQAQLIQLVDGLHATYLEAPLRELWPPFPAPTAPDPKRLPPLVRALAAYPKPRNKSGTENATWKKAIDRNLQAIEQEDWLDFAISGLTPRVLNNDTTYSRHEIPEHLTDTYRDLIEFARADLIGRLYAQSGATFDLLERYHRLAAARKQAQGRFTFDEITRILAGLASTHRLEDVYYRIDARLHHLLLDEFQDTSRSQWDVLQPIAEETVAHPIERSFFSVGDLKQSIYGWRGATPEIFAGLPKLLPGLKSSPMDKSYRSSPSIIQGVNQLFGRSGLLTALADEETAVEEWLSDFHDHETARTELHGQFRVEVAPASEERSGQTVVTLRRAAKRVAEMHREAPERSIGVLVRRNQAVNRLIHELRELGVFASEEGGNPLTDSPAVELILSALKLIEHPTDEVARYHLATSALGRRWNISDPRDPALLKRVRRWRKNLVALGLAPFLSQLVRPLKKISSPRDQLRLDQLLILADRYPSLGLRRPLEFIRLVELERVESPTPSPVRVMTIHQSKGLQFNRVVLPELDGPLFGQTPSILIDRPDAIGPIHGVVRFPNKTLRQLAPELDSYHAQYRRQHLKEQLSLLYVAVTRAEQELIALIAPSNSPKFPATFAGLLRASFATSAAAVSGTQFGQVGSESWIEESQTDAAAVAAPAVSTTPAAAPTQPPKITLSPNRTRFFPRTRPSQSDQERVLAADLLQPYSSGGLERGRTIHRALEDIEWWSEQASAQLPVTIGPNATALLDRSHFVDRHQAPLSTWNRADLAITVANERPFALLIDGEFTVGTFDRLVTVRHDGQVIFVEITDFKSDRDLDDPQRQAASWEQYRPQLETYARAAQRLYELDDSQVVAQIAWLDPDITRRL